MEVKFIGVGEAFDEEYPNTSIQVEAEEGGIEHCILLDCGFTVPPLFWKSCPDGERLDAVWISHFNGDHFLGLPALIARFWQLGRQKPLLVIGLPGVEQIVTQTIGLAYPSVLAKLGYELRFIEMQPGKVLMRAGFVWRSAPNAHSRSDLAVRIDCGGKSLFYSGDGAPTEDSVLLARGADLAVHEAFRMSEPSPGHSTVSKCIDFARSAQVKRLALVHLERNERRRREQIFPMIRAVSELEVFLPEPGDKIRI